MKKYLLIMGDFSYPSAGTENWKGTYVTDEDAQDQVEVIKSDIPGSTCYKYIWKSAKYPVKYDWYEIVDLGEWM